MRALQITVALAACAALAGCYNGHDLSSAEMTTANGAALMFANQANLQFVSCSGLDSEPDGYVTCTVQDRATRMFTKIQCSYSASGGCKAS